MTLPAYKDIGTASATAPSWPTHVTGDFGLLIVTVRDEDAVTPTGWTAVPLSPAINSDPRVYAYWMVAQSSSESAPTIPGVTVNYAWGVILTFTGVHATVPIHRAASIGGGGSNTNGHFPGLLTLINDCLIINAVARTADDAGAVSSGETNASLSGLAERYDAGTTTGSGGGIVVIEGGKATAGAVANTTNTWSGANAYAALTIALGPSSSAPDTRAGQHNRIINAGM